MNQRFVGGMRAALFDSPLVTSRLTLAVGELLWAVMLLWPGDTFVRPTYSMMGQVAPEPCWAVAFLVTALLQAWIVSMELYDTRAAWLFSGWNTSLWFTAIYCMLESVYPPPAAIGGEVALAISALWIFTRPIINKLGEARCAKQRQLAL